MEVNETKLICAICAGSSNKFRHSNGVPNEEDQETFENFCSYILNVAVKDNGEDDGAGASLPRLSREFLLCKQCLVLLKKAVECRELTRQVEARVDKVQMQMLAELKELKRRMEWFYLDVKIIAEFVSRSRSRSETEEPADVSVLRREILKVENSLATYTTKVSRKLLLSDTEEDDDATPIPFNMMDVKIEVCDDDSNQRFENLGVPDVEAGVAPSSSLSTSEPSSSTRKTGKKRRKARASCWYKKRKTTTKSGEQSTKIMNVPEVASDSILNDPDLKDYGPVKVHRRAFRGRRCFKCKYCDSVFDKVKDMRAHTIRMHKGMQKLYRGSDTPPPLTIQATPDAAGEITNEKTGSPNARATKVRTKKARHKCQVCGYFCGGPQALQRHMRHHDQEGKPFKCTLCNCYFSTKIALISHKDFRHKNVQHKVRLIRSNIEVIEDKEAKKRFKCKLCGKTFGMRNNTNIHIKTVHWNYKPYKCPELDCSRAFGRKKSLENHKFAHLKPFECSVCKSKFSRQSDVKKHLKLSHPEAVPEGNQDPIAGTSGNTE